MGWSGSDRRIWGDEPQDIVDRVSKGKSFEALKNNKPLRLKVDKAFQREWGRPANKWEWENLIKVSLGIGGRTLHHRRTK